MCSNCSALPPLLGRHESAPIAPIVGMKSLIAVLGLLAQAAASPSVAPFRQRPLARERAVTLRGGLGKEAPSRQATAPFAALVATHGIVVAGYGGGTLGVGAGSALVACAVASLSEAYKPYMIGVHIALLVQGAAMSKARPVCWPAQPTRLIGRGWLEPRAAWGVSDAQSHLRRASWPKPEPAGFETRRGNGRVWRPVPVVQRAEDARRLRVGGRAPLRRHDRPLSWSTLRREQVQAKEGRGLSRSDQGVRRRHGRHCTTLTSSRR